MVILISIIKPPFALCRDNIWMQPMLLPVLHQTLSLIASSSAIIDLIGLCQQNKWYRYPGSLFFAGCMTNWRIPNFASKGSIGNHAHRVSLFWSVGLIRIPNAPLELTKLKFLLEYLQVFRSTNVQSNNQCFMIIGHKHFAALSRLA